MRYRATLAYDGTDYQGFQRQAGEIPTIQLAVEQAILRVTGQAVVVHGAGRTDTGVHAIGQVIAFDVEWKHHPDKLLQALNAYLPDDIALQDIAETTTRFHPRFSATARLYYYSLAHTVHRPPLLRRTSWQIRGTLDLDAMQQAAAMLIGKHDFAAFGQPPKGENTVREVFQSQWTQEALAFGELLVYQVEATAFLTHMVRRIVGSLVEVGFGRNTLDEFRDIFKSADLSRTNLVAPPQGLTLCRVRYDGEALNTAIKAESPLVS